MASPRVPGPSRARRKSGSREISAISRDGRSARLQSSAPPRCTSPACRPCVRVGRPERRSAGAERAVADVVPAEPAPRARPAAEVSAVPRSSVRRPRARGSRVMSTRSAGMENTGCRELVRQPNRGRRRGVVVVNSSTAGRLEQWAQPWLPPLRRDPATPIPRSSATSASSRTSTTASRRWPTGCSSSPASSTSGQPGRSTSTGWTSSASAGSPSRARPCGCRGRCRRTTQRAPRPAPTS